MPIVASERTTTAGHLSCAARMAAAQIASPFVRLSSAILMTRPTVPEKYEIARAGNDHAAVEALRRAGGSAAAVVLKLGLPGSSLERRGRPVDPGALARSVQAASRR